MEETAASCSCKNTACREEPTFPANTLGPNDSAPRLVVKGVAAKLKARAVASRKASKAKEKDAKSHWKALDRQITKGQKVAEWWSQIASPRGELPTAGNWEQPLGRMRPGTEATSIPALLGDTTEH